MKNITKHNKTAHSILALHWKTFYVRLERCRNKLFSIHICFYFGRSHRNIIIMYIFTYIIYMHIYMIWAIEYLRDYQKDQINFYIVRKWTFSTIIARVYGVVTFVFFLFFMIFLKCFKIFMCFRLDSTSCFYPVLRCLCYQITFNRAMK